MIAVVGFFEFLIFGTWTPTTEDPYAREYYKQFNEAPMMAFNTSLSPPVSAYHALLIALEDNGWNSTSLKDIAIRVELYYCAYTEMQFFQVIQNVTSSPTDWYPQQIGNVTHGYVWIISLERTLPHSIPHAGEYFVDAATAELLHFPIFL